MRFGKFPPQICESCGATYQRNCKMYSALQSTSGSLTKGEKQRPIQCVFGDAILVQISKKN